MRWNQTNLENYFWWINERQRYLLNQRAGKSKPWSTDEIFNRYGHIFFNVKREDDPGNTYLREEVTNKHEFENDGLMVFNVALYQAFGTINFFQEIGGWQTSFEPVNWRLAIERLKANGRVIYTNGYNTACWYFRTVGDKSLDYAGRIFEKLHGLWDQRENIADVARDTQRLSATFAAISLIPGYGGMGFMAYELAIGLRHTQLLADAIDKNTWANPGPGTMATLNWLRDRPAGTRVLRDIAVQELIELLEMAPHHVDLHILPLELRNIEDCCCESGRYRAYKARFSERRNPMQEKREPSNKKPDGDELVTKFLQQFQDAPLVPAGKRPVGRPRTRPLPDPNAPKRPVGRPRTKGGSR